MKMVEMVWSGKWDERKEIWAVCGWQKSREAWFQLATSRNLSVN